METDYDRKFDEMKKYIPFLESMIKRLENTGSTTQNPRQAQLAKIRSLRDLLLNKKKRMKMENLLKCEQVLVNLYAKVEQRDSFSEARNDIDTTQNSKMFQLEFVRNKLKNVTSHLQDSESLPEIAQDCKTEEVCTAGSKQPALRRTNKIISPIRCPVPENNKSTPTSNKRSYTRVLLSPEREPDGWPRDRASYKSFFNRKSPICSPKKSPLKQFSSHNRKGRKVDPSHSQNPCEQLKDLNITLKVPEESLNSLNTKDILSRIINCSDGDVDIDTLRELRTQILSELKQTGTKDDISDLILKSYKNKKSKEKKRAEVEEGELSDSESEVIESVYGSLVLVDKEGSNLKYENKCNEKEQQPRKIQICLVINSEKEGNSELESPKDSSSHNTLFDESDFELFRGSKETDLDNNKAELKKFKDIKNNVSCSVESNESLCGETKIERRNEVSIGGAQQSSTVTDKVQPYDGRIGKVQPSKDEITKANTSENQTSEVLAGRLQTSELQVSKIQSAEPQVQIKENESVEIGKNEVCSANIGPENKIGIGKANNSNTNAPNSCTKKELNMNTENQTPKIFSPNFYKPILNQNTPNDIAASTSTVPSSLNDNLEPGEENEHNRIGNCSKLKDPVEIPLLDLEASVKREVVQEIDILQALKKEILSEKISLSSPDIATPPLHQPKLTKVENMHTMLPKKRISIERYKEKSTSVPRSTLFINDVNGNPTKDELLRKQSLKLTEKEYERFNLSGKIAINESSDEDDKGKISPIDDVYSKLAPKSPDHEDFADTGIKPPVIIPADPIKTTAVCSKTDVDMRMMSVLSSTHSSNIGSRAPSPSANIDKAFDVSRDEAELNVNDKPLPLIDPRMRRDFNYPNKESPKLGFMEHTHRPTINFSSTVAPILMPNSMSNMTPNRIAQTSNVIPNMVPNVTTNVNVFEISSSRQSFESDSYSNQDHVYAPIFSINETQDYNDDVKIRDDLRNKSEFQNMYVENNSPIYNLSECPQTPVHPFGVSECTSNSNHSFARLETPMTPIHSFGRSEAPMTPVHPFGRSDCPSTPSHPFSRTEILMTPTHPFGRNDFSKNQSQIPPIRYSNYQDPRMNRSSDYDNKSRYNDEKLYDNYKERTSPNFNPHIYKYDQSKRNYPDSYRSYSSRQKSVGRYDNRSATYDQESRYGERSTRHESNIGHSSSRSNKADRIYCNDRSKGYKQRDYRYETDSSRGYNDPCASRRNYRREHSIVRTFPWDRYTERNNDSIFKSDKTLSVHSHAGRSFTIDTSVSRSFQENLTNLGNTSLSESNFDARRTRASSVGRFLTREPSVVNVLPDLEVKNRSLSLQNKFRRACSVGRDTVRYNATKNFSDIKKELQAFKNASAGKIFHSKVSSLQPSAGVSKKGHERDPRLSRRDQNDIQNSRKEKHTFRHEDYRNKDKKYYDSPKEKTQEIQKHGIIYSTDNIAKGTILGLGYGVKNYKIPKIKKPAEDAGNQEVTEDNKTLGNKITNNTCEKKNAIENKEINTVKQECSVIDVGKGLIEVNEIVKKDKVNLKEQSENLQNGSKSKVENEMINLNTSNNVEKRVTRSAKRIVNEMNIKNCGSSQKKDTKNRKSVLQISDSDDDDIPVINFNKDSHNEPSKENEINAVLTQTVDKTNSPSINNDIKTNVDHVGDAEVNNETKKTDEPESRESPVFNEDSSILDSDNCFGIELEMFSENIATDPVIENIHALIADLDDDLETSKNYGTKNQFTKEINLENMLNSITCVDKKGTDSAYNETKDITETVGEEVNPMINKITLDNKIENNKKAETVHECIDMKIEHNNEVSTTDQEMPLLLPKETIQKSLVSCSLPDSTIDVNLNTHRETDNAKGNEEVPDSTDESICQINSDVTSTYNSLEVNTVKASSSRELQQQGDSLGSLLSILQDKSKIKELLSMLKDQSSENEKLKKKLEKLREIVSDDDDDDDKLPPNVMSSLSCNSNILSKDNEVEVYQSEVSAINNLSKDSLVDHDTKVINTPVKEVVDLVNPSNCLNSTSSSQLKHLKEENFEELKTIEGQEISPNLEKSSKIESKAKDDDKCEGIQNNSIESEHSETPKKVITKNTKTHKGKAKFKNNNIDENKRFTRSESVGVKNGKTCGAKVPSRELKQLQEDIKEMFMHDDMFNANGIRMCRLAKLVEDKTQFTKGEQQNVETGASSETLFKGKTSKKKNVTKNKITQKNTSVDMENSNENSIIESKLTSKCKVGPRSKTKILDQYEVDPYMFESDSVSESNHTNVSESKFGTTSESECDSIASSRSHESKEQITELKKKPKRKRRGWQAGVIKSKNKKRKLEINNCEKETTTSENQTQETLDSADVTCFTDKMYCFSKNVTNYSCRFCSYEGNEIVHHYKKQHPHFEIPLSRMSPEVAKEAIEQSEEINATAISKLSTDKYICRFCFKEFSRKKTILEAFFWHVVSAHTGEYKQLCSECINIERCPFDLDIPPPPKELKGQLLGFICGKCNFTQLSLENMKSHVITRHNNEQTEVSVINLAVISKKALLLYTKLAPELEPRRSRRLVQTMKEVKGEVDPNTSSDICTESVTNKSSSNRMKSQITFENDDDENEKCELNETTNIKLEPEEEIVSDNISQFERTPSVQYDHQALGKESPELAAAVSDEVPSDFYEPTTSNDVLDYPHFKMSHTKAGTMEYVCCINGVENHYVTPLLISFKKHVQIKHKEKWDGFCFLCKLIVTPIGEHYFKDCLQHFLEKHMDEFPLIEKEDAQLNMTDEGTPAQAHNSIHTKNYVNVRPLSELVSQAPPQQLEPMLPVIEKVVSLGAPLGSTSSCHEGDLVASEVNTKKDIYKYEEAQADIMNKKHNVVLEIMMSHEKLVNLFKCAGRFCSYSSDNAEDALRHALVHERMGGENSLVCAYCGFDSLNNSVDLVTHVFKYHGGCQYACAQCFYRAAASQLVRAHAMRKHAETAAPSAAQCPVLRSTVASPSALTDTILPRELAVPFYVCNQLLNGEKCKFKSYTLGKFCEHYRSRHATDDEYSCYCCSVVFPQYLDLLQHMKGHGFKLYQCTWCVHGADNEGDLLAHASEKHPNKQPQAYLRVITNTEGAVGYRVLPLAQLNNSKIPTVDVTPNSTKGNPEREAQRSVDLEKLIGQTTRMTSGSQATTTQSPSVKNDEHSDAFGLLFNSEPISQNQDAWQSSLLTETQEVLSQTSGEIHRSVTPTLIEQSTENDVHKQLTPILKIRPAEQKTPKMIDENEIVCLDSDDEPSNQNVDSDHDSPTVEHTKSNSMNLVPLSSLFKCGVCEDAVFENSANYMRHVTTLHPQTSQLPCAHCSFRGTKVDIVNHYNSEHNMNEMRRYICGVCNNKYVSLVFAKRHIREAHNFSKVVVTSKTVTKGKHQFIVGKLGKNKKPSKRKRSIEHEDKRSQPAPKLKKFGPDDINLLPINPILDDLVYCALCEFGTKVRLNMVRHLQLHAEQQPVPRTAPVNPVPHLETNEKHFDKMLNLASSSIASRVDKSNRPDQPAASSSHVPPEAAARYPKYVPERQRYTCGAKGCCYISVDEVMLKYHWETLHSDANDFHCVHCPPYQYLDTSKQLTASRIIAHLKMHDVRLYACSCCPYYHHRKQVVEKHIDVYHNTGHVMVVREDSTAPAPNTIPTSTATPTMDLKPWQCGLCKFKSMLRPEVAEHCAKVHQSKMQYKCIYCAFRTSTLESVQKHQHNAHPDRAPETFYFYYREGTIPDEPDGTPRWQKQTRSSGLTETLVKAEALECAETELQSESSRTDPPPHPVIAVDLNIVKRDPDAEVAPEHNMQDLCNSFGQFCEPNGLKYKCPLCKIVSEESKEAMQSHLYEELQYRKWECGFCSYRAFHKNGLNEHMLTEHRQIRDPIELPVDSRVETWITKALDYQFLLIERNKQNLTKQRMSPNLILSPPISRTVVTAGPAPINSYTNKELEYSFGKFGAPNGLSYSCPKCSLELREENVMRDHLEMELNKIRWCCNSCTEKFQNYHEAQFHCKTAHAGQAGSAARAVEAVRDMTMRSAWISAVIESQKHSMSNLPAPGTDESEVPRHGSALDNSLLVVRYEERVPTPEMLAPSLRPPSLDSDEDEKLVIDEPSQNTSKVCPFCMSVSKDLKDFKDHVAQHDNIKPYFCSSCDFNSYRKAVLKHIAAEHAGQSVRLLTKAQRSRGPPLRSSAPAAGVASTSAVSAIEDESAKLICLNCEKSFTEHEAKNHTHESMTPAFAKKGQVVVKCCICLRLHESVEAATAHHRACHPTESLNYAYYKLHYNKRSLYCCGYCEQHFKFWRDLKVHWKATHSSLPLQFSKRLFGGAPGDAVLCLSDDDEIGGKRKCDGVSGGAVHRMCARKSTTKLPFKAVAKKSTTKLPLSESEHGEYSFYGTRPPERDMNDVRTSLTFGCTDVSFSFKQLSEVIKINPTVLVEDIKK